jgi:Fic family protein
MRVEVGALGDLLTHAAYGQGEVAGALRSLSAADWRSVERRALADTALATSALAGEPLSADSVDASLGQLLNGEPEAAGAVGPRTAGVVALTVDARRNARSLLTTTRLLRWQRHVVGSAAAPVEAWRGADETPDAPPLERLGDEVQALLIGLAGPAERPPLVRAALAYLRFRAIRPFADGNGRIGRALADVVIARGATAAAPFVSLARQMHEEGDAYRSAREAALSGDLDVTAWVAWFIGCYTRATAHTLAAIDERLRIGKFWRDTAGVEMNSRQRRVLERYLSQNAFEKISSRTYSAIAQTSTDSAQRDLADLARKHIIVPNDGKARRTSYRLRDDFFIQRPVESETQSSRELEPSGDRSAPSGDGP